MTNLKFKVQDRNTTLNPRQLRQSGFVPATIYGKGIDSKNIQLDTHEFELAYKKNKDAVWELELNKEKFFAKIAEAQINYATGEFLNIEFALAK